MILLLVYVDDVVVIGNDEAMISTLDTRFALKDLGTLSYFLGLQVHYLPSVVLLNQQKYVDDLLTKMNLTNLKPAHTLSVLGTKLSLLSGSPLLNPYEYRSAIGALQYLTHTSPDIAHIVNQLNQYLKAPTDVHWQTVKWVLHYISGTRNYGLYIFSKEMIYLLMLIMMSTGPLIWMIINLLQLIVYLLGVT